MKWFKKLLSLKRVRRMFPALLSIFVITDDISYTAVEFTDKASKGKKRHRIMAWVFSFWFFLLVLFITSLSLVWDNATLFNVNAITEKVAIKASEFSGFAQWRMIDVDLRNGCDDTIETHTGILSVTEHSEIEIERVGLGPIKIGIFSTTGRTVGTLETDQGDIVELRDCAALTVSLPENGSITWLVDGNIIVGSQPKEATETHLRLLKTGSVTIADKAIVSNEYYLSEPHSLNLGDTFYIENPTTQGSGLLHVSNSPALQITYSGKGERGYIQRYKTEEIPLENNIWVKLINDETLIFGWVLLLVVYTVVKLIIRLSLD